MKHFYKALTKVIKYAVGREEFEKAIDEAPHDALNHLGYADWLDENAETNEDKKEAAFRRSIGEWVQHHQGIPLHKPIVIPYERPEDDQANLNTYRLPYYPSHDPFHLPAGVDKRLFPIQFSHTNDYPGSGPWDHNGELLDEPIGPHIPHYHSYRNEFSWPSYRAMEETFRRAFLKKK